MSSELARALARPDVEHLKYVSRIYHDWSCRPDPNDDQYPDEIDEWFNSPHEDQDKALALIILAAASYDEPRFLAVLAAGILEELLWTAPDVDLVAKPEIVARIVDEAAKTPRFKWMLSGVWLYSATPGEAVKVTAAVGDISMDNDPLPPRPFA